MGNALPFPEVVVQVAKRLLVGRELLVELKEGVDGRVIVRRAIELVDES